ncbi:protein-glutamate methylesterase/protein-glutamine glutaminase [Cohnella rhizosphaerae]|uniref:Protein-glutamate methylesterase/protein-glutamine glutaminase n=1 Tax=Cohnella rhizosphaerae TaxID=1457232 RepID=A0A9X4KQU5_9BACL|nr:chemotaxis response regulator protein-glutamate methylesterase [Cohnella rhizosphaerae]MDG0809511.1 chemotaxis response regulator protein-glutamate methylesterase [Cohnella rhizosphaerae]
MAAIRVLVVDDSIFMRKLIKRLLEEDPELSVPGVATNGAEAVRMTQELVPDVVTMDVEMPGMNGLDAVSAIMRSRPVPIVMLSSQTQEGAAATIDALRRGAVDFVGKPSGSTSFDLYKVRTELVAKVKAASKTRKTALKLPSAAVNPAPRGAAAGAVREDAPGFRSFGQIVAIGTSTGGPRALDAVLTALPPDFRCPVLVVQHMPPRFTKSLAERLNAICEVRVSEAEDGESLRGGRVYIAPGDKHLTIAEKGGAYVVKLTEEPLRSGHRPSVDVLFESVARLSRLKRHYVIMTGMGQDGAKGMLLAKELGAASTIAESQETCVVYGMPRSAVELGCVEHIVPLGRIADKIVQVTGKD